MGSSINEHDQVLKQMSELSDADSILEDCEGSKTASEHSGGKP